LPVIAQEFVKGTEVNVIALGDGKGNTIAAVPMRKQYITDKGKAWGGITLADEKMMELTRMIIQKTKWKGGMELELIKNQQRRILSDRNQSADSGMGLPCCGCRAKHSGCADKTGFGLGCKTNDFIQNRKNVCALFVRHDCGFGKIRCNFNE
jgi:hypothetical protein